MEVEQEGPRLAQHLQGAQVASQIVMVDPVVDEGVRGAGLVAEVVDAVAEASADEVRAVAVPVAGVDVDRVPSHGFAQVENLRVAGAQVFDPDTVTRVPLAVAPAPSTAEAPVAGGFLPRHQGITEVEEPVPAAELDLSIQPLDQPRQHPVRVWEGAGGRRESPGHFAAGMVGWGHCGVWG